MYRNPPSNFILMKCSEFNFTHSHNRNQLKNTGNKIIQYFIKDTCILTCNRFGVIYANLVYMAEFTKSPIMQKPSEVQLQFRYIFWNIYFSHRSIDKFSQIMLAVAEIKKKHIIFSYFKERMKIIYCESGPFFKLYISSIHP